MSRKTDRRASFATKIPAFYYSRHQPDIARVGRNGRQEGQCRRHTLVSHAASPERGERGTERIEQCYFTFVTGYQQHRIVVLCLHRQPTVACPHSQFEPHNVKTGLEWRRRAAIQRFVSQKFYDEQSMSCCKRSGG